MFQQLAALLSVVWWDGPGLRGGATVGVLLRLCVPAIVGLWGAAVVQGHSAISQAGLGKLGTG